MEVKVGDFVKTANGHSGTVVKVFPKTAYGKMVHIQGCDKYAPVRVLMCQCYRVEGEADG